MNILIYTNHFYPEQFKVNEIAFDLAERGESVTVITGIPNYPQGKFPEGYGFLKRRKERINGVDVIRLPLIPRGNGSGVRLAINYISFFIATLLYLPFVLFRKWDLVFVHETSPVFIGIAAVLTKRIKKIPLYFWVLDLWPESVTAASGFSNKTVLNGLEKLVKWIYIYSDKILISSKGFTKSILEKGDFKDKIVYFPNWAEEIFENPDLNQTIPDLPDGFKIMYAGNMGEAQDLEKVLTAANSLKTYKDIKWILIGDGRKKSWIDNYIQENGLQESVYPLGRYPVNMMPAFYNKADVMLLSLKDEPIFALTVPARLQSYMVCGKPVVAMINGEAADVILDAECGLVTNSGNADELASHIMELYQSPKEELQKMGKASKDFYEENFKRTKLLTFLHNLFQH